jgi:hypothetical protein
MAEEKSLLVLVKQTLLGFGWGLVLQVLLYCCLSGLAFLIAGFMTSHTGLGLGIAWSIPFAIAYSLVGGILGFALAVIAQINQSLTNIERNFHGLMETTVSSLLPRLPWGQSGIPINQFQGLLGSKTTEFLQELGQQKFGLLNGIARLLLGRLLQITNTVFVNNFVDDLTAKGETSVNLQTVERFSREKLIGFVMETARGRVDGVQWVVWAMGSAILLLSALTFIF